MIALDSRALLGGAVSSDRRTAAKIGLTKTGPAKTDGVTLDRSRLLSRNSQAHGAKIGDGKMMSPFAQQLPATTAKGE